MMFQSSIRDIKYKLNLIDSLQRFSLPHLFQQEINNLLEQIHHSFIEDNTIIEDNNYHSLALLFRLFRQQGYRISSGTCILFLYYLHVKIAIYMYTDIYPSKFKIN